MANSICFALLDATKLPLTAVNTTLGILVGNHKVREVLCPRVVKQVGFAFTSISQ